MFQTVKTGSFVSVVSTSFFYRHPPDSDPITIGPDIRGYMSGIADTFMLLPCNLICAAQPHTLSTRSVIVAIDLLAVSSMTEFPRRGARLFGWLSFIDKH